MFFVCSYFFETCFGAPSQPLPSLIVVATIGAIAFVGRNNSSLKRAPRSKEIEYYVLLLLDAPPSTLWFATIPALASTKPQGNAACFRAT